jgi:hypothetical protein
MFRALFTSCVSSIDCRESGSSYYWLVRFENGAVIPYPLMNLEGVNASPYAHGGIQKSIKEKTLIVLRETLIRVAYIVRPSVKAAFSELQDQIA